IALFQYYPFLYLIGKSENMWYMLLPLLGFVFIIPCYVFFRFGLRKYKSTGS
ncbi:MAG: ABC-2 family transporter protein, partial [Clostridia bacterium]|nr:ABC-2 family transporter protein [Clostridia bacterium]